LRSLQDRLQATGLNRPTTRPITGRKGHGTDRRLEHVPEAQEGVAGDHVIAAVTAAFGPPKKPKAEAALVDELPHRAATTARRAVDSDGGSQSDRGGHGLDPRAALHAADGVRPVHRDPDPGDRVHMGPEPAGPAAREVAVPQGHNHPSSRDDRLRAAGLGRGRPDSPRRHGAPAPARDVTARGARGAAPTAEDQRAGYGPPDHAGPVRQSRPKAGSDRQQRSAAHWAGSGEPARPVAKDDQARRGLRDEVTQIRHQFQIRKPKPRSSASRRSSTRTPPNEPKKS